MKKEKLLKINLILCLIIFLFPIKSIASVPASPKDYYYDELGMLDNKTKENIIATNKELYQKTGSQVVVATIKNPSGLPASDLGPKIFNAWQIGDKTKKNGVLILISKDDIAGKNEIFITTGYGIEGRLNDGKVGRIIDNYMLNDLKSGNYSIAINEGFNSIVAEIADEYGVSMNGNYNAYLETNGQQGGLSIGTIFIFFVMFIIFSNIFTRRAIYGYGPRNRRYYGRRNRYGRYYNDPFGSYGWGKPSNKFGGGSSFGGSSFGGSSGSFTGGGGSSGGGGAGRSF